MSYFTEIFSLRDRIALVTGGSMGLGAAMARAMAEWGAHVVLNARNEERLAAKVEEFTTDGLKATAASWDVTELDQSREAIKKLIAEHGRLDVLINNAGTAVSIPFTDYPLDTWLYDLNIHLNAGFVLAQEAAKQMVRQGKGSIINMCSIVGPTVAGSEESSYAAGKSGLMGMTRAMAVELGPKGVRTNAIAPGYFHTSLGGILAEGEPPTEEQKSFIDYIVTHIPIGRLADPKELGGLAVYLASDASSFVNGQLIHIDGGQIRVQ